MRRVSFGYIAQLDLPGGPIKIGQSKAPRHRLQAFDVATPVACRMIGITINGSVREAEMLDATDGAVIKGEWRYPTDRLFRLIQSYHKAGEWFVMAADHKRHFARTNVIERVGKYSTSYKACPQAIGYFWSSEVLNAAQQDDPMLGVDWSGFERAKQAPSFIWPNSRAAA